MRNAMWMICLKNPTWHSKLANAYPWLTTRFSCVDLFKMSIYIEQFLIYEQGEMVTDPSPSLNYEQNLKLCLKFATKILINNSLI